MKRHSNWATRLHLLIESSKDVTFDWGKYNCGLFVARWIREATGVDLGTPYVGKATDEASAEANGMLEISPITYAQRGDVVWLDNSTPANPSKYGALGIVSLDGRYAVCMSEKGTVRVHLKRWKRAWRVG